MSAHDDDLLHVLLSPTAGMVLHPCLHGQPLDPDAVLYALHRARSVLALLLRCGEDECDGFGVPHRAVLGSLQALNGMLAQLQALADAAAGIRSQGAES